MTSATWNGDGSRGRGGHSDSIFFDLAHEVRLVRKTRATHVPVHVQVMSIMRTSNEHYAKPARLMYLSMRNEHRQAGGRHVGGRQVGDRQVGDHQVGDRQVGE